MVQFSVYTPRACLHACLCACPDTRQWFERHMAMHTSTRIRCMSIRMSMDVSLRTFLHTCIGAIRPVRHQCVRHVCLHAWPFTCVRTCICTCQCTSPYTCPYACLRTPLHTDLDVTLPAVGLNKIELEYDILVIMINMS